MHRRLGAALVAAALLLTLGLESPAIAAAPGQVGLVSFVAASRTSLTLTWPTVAGATSYEVWRASSPSMSDSVPVASSTAGTSVVGDLAPGQTYCFQVRAMQGSHAGLRSRRACKPTILDQSTSSGPLYRVMSFNACSEKCAGWPSRQVNTLGLVAARSPDVLAMQEAGALTRGPVGYTQAVSKSAKRLFYRTARFSVASSAGKKRVGYVQMSASRPAVWAELVDRANAGKHVIFVSVHTTTGVTAYALRGSEIKRLLLQMRAINPGRLPVVFAGDFNSYRSRGTYDPSTGRGGQDTVGAAFASAGYQDAYDLADRLIRPNWNTFSGFLRTPTLGYTWGDHVDHVYVQPGTSHVLRWLNAARTSGSHYVTPRPSDHSALEVDVRLD